MSEAAKQKRILRTALQTFVTAAAAVLKKEAKARKAKEERRLARLVKQQQLSG